LVTAGSARKIIATKDDTTLIEGSGDQRQVASRIAEIKAQIEHASSEYDKENLEKRLAALAGKVAVIKVGGATETEIDEKKFRVDDAVAATKAAVAEGIVPGGGVTLVDLSKKLTVEPTKIGSSEEAGHLVLKRALVQPFRELMRNAGLNPDEKLPLVIASKGGQGFDVNEPSNLVDLKAKGIVDPAKVTREAVQNAVSIAGTAMTMGSLIVDIPEEKSAPAGGGMPGMGGMGGMDY
jgi:chaperonin GroEL